MLGDDASAVDESFHDNLLEYPQYTRPAEFRGMSVPDVLRSGDHAKVDRWRREQSLARTASRRPDLLDEATPRLPTARFRIFTRPRRPPRLKRYHERLCGEDRTSSLTKGNHWHNSTKKRARMAFCALCSWSLWCSPACGACGPS